MTCLKCVSIARSHAEQPFIPPVPGPTNDTYICFCGQRWWRYNTYYELWSRVNDEATWKNILSGAVSPIAIGNPSRNVERPESAEK